MDNVHGVKISNSLAELLEEEPCLVFAQGFLLALTFNVLEQAHSIHKLLDQVDFLRSFKVLNQLYYIGMVHFLHACDFPLHCFPFCGIVQFKLWIDFDSHLLLGLFVLS